MGGLLNHAEFFETVALRVRVFCGDVLSVEKGLPHLKAEEGILFNALLCSISVS
jgi:hypothetical protein